MSYTGKRVNIQTGIDEFGYEYGLYRRPSESVVDFQKRLLSQVRDPKKPTETWFVKNATNTLGLQRQPAIDIELVMVNGEPVALDPFVEITSSFIRGYSEYSDSEIVFEIDLRDTHLLSIVSQINATAEFTATLYSEDLQYKLGTYLQVDNSRKFVVQEKAQNTKCLKLKNGLIASIHPFDSGVFTNEVGGPEYLVSEGDFYIDYTNGVLFTVTSMKKPINYAYNKFPFRTWYSPARVWTFDGDSDYLLKDSKISETGFEAPTVLNSLGKSKISEIYNVHPFTWGIK